MEPIKREYLGNGVTASVSEGFSFGTDTLMLADFSLQCAPFARRAADLGTGCGVIPLLWASQREQLQIDAVEIQEQGVALAKLAAEENRFLSRITVHCADLRSGELPVGRYDLVACNPPYFRSGSGAKCPKEQRQIARAEETLTLPELCTAAARLLRTGGAFCLCHRTERLAGVMHALCQAGLTPKKLQLVRTSPKREPKLFLLCAIKGGGEGLTLLQERKIGCETN